MIGGRWKSTQGQAIDTATNKLEGGRWKSLCPAAGSAARLARADVAGGHGWRKTRNFSDAGEDPDSGEKLLSTIRLTNQLGAQDDVRARAIACAWNERSVRAEFKASSRVSEVFLSTAGST
ncbi:hypothetical protein B0H11DRAFT_1926353 [Mycena galericulata]|nr:hypothetical protein B0H11DRAFT_1926353 [Mycena galericulata]